LWQFQQVYKEVKRIVYPLAAWLIVFGLARGLSAQESSLAGSGGHHKIEVRDEALGQKMAAAGARLIADYGGYKLYDAPGSMTNLPADKAELRDDYNVIALNAARLDTTQPAAQPLRKKAGNFSGNRLHLIQFAGPVQAAWRQELLEAGVKIVSYIPHNAYLVYGDAASVARVQALAAAPHVQWEGAYADEYKIHPAAKAGAAKGDQFAIQLMADEAANAATLQLIDRLKRAPVSRQRQVLHYVDVVARVAPADLPQIAARPDVISIQPYGRPRKLCERQDQIVAGNVSGTSLSGPGYLNWLAGRGFTQAQFSASGFSVDLSDSGIDNGTTHPNHFGLYVAGETNEASRVIYNRLEGMPNPGSTIEGCDGHGNINGHIVGGYDDGSGFPFEDSAGYHYGLGVCPFVALGSSVIFDPTNFTDASYEDLMSQAFTDGARISNNSWGDSGADGTYNLDAQEYDALVRDAQPDGSAFAAPGNREMVIVFAAGNDGPTAGSVSPPGTGKNIISVGAAESVQPFGGSNGGADLGDTTDSQANNANAMVSFSGRGPCADGRQKPDLVAPGTHISGGAPQDTNPDPTTGTALPCFLENTTNSIGVDGGSDGSFFFPDSGQEFYTASSGTSHSTPCVSGGCALVRQYFINQGWAPPSPAMTKAWLINSARYLSGSGADDTLWSRSQGMGEMDLGTAFDGTPRLLRDEAAGDLFTASGQSRVFKGVVRNSSQPFRVTVAWTDAPGSTTGAAYNNDLDLTVSVGGKTYKGNVFSGANSTIGGTADARNNVESVFLAAGASGPFTVTITAANINSAGVPNAENLINQDFALVVYNAGAAPALAAGSAILASESCTPTNGVIDPEETVTVEFTVENAGPASTTNLVATLLASNGVAFPSGAQTYGALAPGAAGTAAYSFDAYGACGSFITATLQLQDGTADLGTVSYNFQLGKLVATTNFAENFDEVSPPGLPAGWSTSDLAGQVGWTTESSTNDTPPNAVYCPDSDFYDEVFLVSPPITLPSGPSQLSFRQSFNLEDQYDGGVLEIKIGGATSFTDIKAAGGSFVTGGYVEKIQSDDLAICQDDPLVNQVAWSGTSDGFMTTIVNLPRSAEGQTIQLRWGCGTDCNNESLLGIGGWWIDSIVVTQTNWACCSSTASAAPVIRSPTDGYQSAVATVEIAGITLPGASVILYDNGTSNETITAGADGIFSALARLAFGSNIIYVTQTGTTNSSSFVTVVVLPAAPTLKAAAQSGPMVGVSGNGAAGAVINVLANGVLAANFTNNSSGNYAGTLPLPAGTNSLSATETVNGLTSGPSATVFVVVSIEPVPVILTPPNGLSTNNATLTVTGTGLAGATVSLYDGTNLLGTTLVNSLKKFSRAVKLPNGTQQLTATQTAGGITSAPSAAVSVTMNLSPTITAQPQSLTGFIGETVMFSSAAYGAAPFQYSWEKNGVKIAGAATTNLTLAGLVAASAATYQMIASNSYGSAISTQAVLTVVPNPFTQLTGTYYGLFAESPAQFQSSGFLTLTLRSLGTYSAKILNAGGGYSFSGAFTVTGQGTAPVSRGKGVTPLIVNMNLDLSGGTEQILGTVSNAGWSAGLQADRATFSATNPCPNAGKYTLALESGGGSQSPGGYGYGTATISAAGSVVSLSGVLSDNTTVLLPSASGVSKTGQWPLYIPLYGKLGSLSGWIDFTNGPSVLAGEAGWFRVGASGKLYPAGFTNYPAITGSTFAPGTTRVPVLSETNNLNIILSGGGLGTNLTNTVTLYNTGRFVTNGAGIPKLTLSVVPSTGVVSGSFLDPLTLLATPIKGVVLQQQTNAAGFFVSTNATGTFILTPE
jgi:hypothetical protein